MEENYGTLISKLSRCPLCVYIACFLLGVTSNAREVDSVTIKQNKYGFRLPLEPKVFTEFNVEFCPFAAQSGKFIYKSFSNRIAGQFLRLL